MTRPEDAAREIHSHGCSCDGCAPYRNVRAATGADRAAWMAIAGLGIGLALCEGYALIARAPHITVLFGGNG